MIPAPLRSAYLAAVYRFGDGASAMELRPGQRCEALNRWMQDSGLRCAAVLTAFNPGSARRDPAFNSLMQRRLGAAIAARGLPAIEGQNLDPAGAWPVESSLLVGNLSLESARQLAREFGQLGFLWIDSSAVPELHATDDA